MKLLPAYIFDRVKSPWFNYRNKGYRVKHFGNKSIIKSLYTPTEIAAKVTFRVNPDGTRAIPTPIRRLYLTASFGGCDEANS